MNKVLLIGIDSLEFDLLEKYSSELPNFSKLIVESPTNYSDSIFPADSIPAWVSIYTGWNPARHGIVYAFDIFESNLADILNIDFNIFKGKTFWDYASNAGKKVCIINPFLAYPSWQVNGVMISKSTNENKVDREANWLIEKKTDVYPLECINTYDIPPVMRGVSGKHPGIKSLKNWAEEAKNALNMEFELGLKICEHEDWDLFFIFFGWLDIIQHRLWRYSDELDPTYPGNTQYKDIIKEFYRALDLIVGKYIELYPNATVIVFSDHGHGIRPPKTANLNEVLRKMELLKLNNKSFSLLTRLKEFSKRELLEFAFRFDLDFRLVDLSTKTRSLSSISKNIYASASSIDMNSSIAYLSSFAGIKSYTHGGIEIEKNNLGDKSYEAIRDQIINALIEMKLPHCDEKLIKWACKREDLYQGPNVSQAYPDIVFELNEGYGTNWSLYTPIIGRAYDHKLSPGGHRKKAVFLIRNSNLRLRTKNISIIDIAPSILDLLSIDYNSNNFDGKSIFIK